jgi:hypothetical protein
MKRLYYTIEKEIDETGESLTGNKNIAVYEIVDGKIKNFASIDSTNDANSVKEIKEYLTDHELDSKEFEFQLL